MLPIWFFNQQVINIVKKANYKMAFAIFENVPLWHIDLFALPRIPIPSHQKMWEFKLKVSSMHIIFVAMRKWERQFKQLKINFLKNRLHSKIFLYFRMQSILLITNYNIFFIIHCFKSIRFIIILFICYIIFYFIHIFYIYIHNS